SSLACRALRRCYAALLPCAPAAGLTASKMSRSSPNHDFRARCWHYYAVCHDPGDLHWFSDCLYTDGTRGAFWLSLHGLECLQPAGAASLCHHVERRAAGRAAVYAHGLCNG